MKLTLAISILLLGACSVGVEESPLPAHHPANPDAPIAVDAPMSPAPVAAPATTAYPLDTCVVTGAKLGEMGDPVILMHEGREVRLCCSNCVKKFNADPATYLKKLDEAGKHKHHGGHR